MGRSGVPESSRVAAIMSRPVLTLPPQETIAKAASAMTERKVGSVVVVEGEKPVGILTERDLVRFAGSGGDPKEATIAEWMTPNPDTLGPEEDIATAFGELSTRGYRHIPVVDGGELVGIVSMRDMMRVARIHPVEEHGKPEVPKGLEGVEVAETAIGDVRGLEGFYHYRQYSAVELAEKRTLEDVWHLLHEGELPRTPEQSRAFADSIRALREVPSPVGEFLPYVSKLGEEFVPLDALRTSLSAAAEDLGFRPWLDIGYEELKEQARRICALVPTLLCSLYRLRRGQQPVPPNPELPFAANYLYMLTGEVPSAEHARAIEQYMILVIDHGFNASTFTARVITSTGADLGAALTGAVGALSGPLHGGAPSRALDMLDAIGTPENAEPWLRQAVSQGKRLMGFGHRVYKTEDPRSRMLKSIAAKLGGDKVSLAEHIERTAVRVLDELKPGRKLYANVEFYAGVVMDACGLPREMFTPTFASGRVIGWTAHILEQASDNRLIRPSARYVGPEPPQPVPTL